MMTFILFSGTAEKKRYGFDFISINFSILNAKGKAIMFSFMISSKLQAKSFPHLHLRKSAFGDLC